MNQWNLFIDKYIFKISRYIKSVKVTVTILKYILSGKNKIAPYIIMKACNILLKSQKRKLLKFSSLPFNKCLYKVGKVKTLL